MDDDQRVRPVTLSLLVLALVLALWAGYFLLVRTNPEIPFWSGSFGDSFGALNTLFSGLAFAGIIVTILLQTHELKLQGKELRATRQVMTEQTRNFEKQLLDDSFYQQIRLYNENVNVLRAEHDTDIPQYGRAAIANILEQAWIEMERNMAAQRYKNETMPPERVPPNWQINSFTNAYHEIVWPRLSHVIQSFMAIAELIYSTDQETRAKYKRFFWAQCSVAEQQLFRLYIITPRVSFITIKMLKELDMVYAGPWGVGSELENVLREEYRDVMRRAYADH